MTNPPKFTESHDSAGYEGARESRWSWTPNDAPDSAEGQTDDAAREATY
jgi:hypothetical protein